MQHPFLYDLWVRISLTMYAQKKGAIVMRYSMRYVHGHVAVYSPEGVFLFSADTREEAYRFMEEYFEELQDRS